MNKLVVLDCSIARDNKNTLKHIEAHLSTRWKGCSNGGVGSRREAAHLNTMPNNKVRHLRICHNLGKRAQFFSSKNFIKNKRKQEK